MNNALASVLSLQGKVLVITSAQNPLTKNFCWGIFDIFKNIISRDFIYFYLTSKRKKT